MRKKVFKAMAAIASGEGDTWTTVSAPIRNAKGSYDIFCVFKRKSLFNLDWWQFNK